MPTKTFIPLTNNPSQSYFRPEEASREPQSTIAKINAEFIRRMDAADYPCVGAKSALHTGHYRLGSYGVMGEPATTLHLAADLKTYIGETLATGSNYMTMVAVFTDEIQSETVFEQKLWRQLQQLHDADGDAPWDPAVGHNPEANDFSFSFDGAAFFIVGLHPHASRK